VTLAYFIEPNPGERGWLWRHRYASHALHFAVKRALESVDEFRRRINAAAASEEEGFAPVPTGADNWRLGRIRNVGSIHSGLLAGNCRRARSRFRDRRVSDRRLVETEPTAQALWPARPLRADRIHPGHERCCGHLHSRSGSNYCAHRGHDVRITRLTDEFIGLHRSIIARPVPPSCNIGSGLAGNSHGQTPENGFGTSHRIRSRKSACSLFDSARMTRFAGQSSCPRKLSSWRNVRLKRACTDWTGKAENNRPNCLITKAPALNQRCKQIWTGYSCLSGS
jgi:hypothetical protein